MDLVNQSKFRNILIVVLLILNLLTVSIIWMQTIKKSEPQITEKDSRPSESVDLMKKTLDLTDDQTKQLERLRTDQLVLSKQFNDRLDILKKELAEELFKEKPDTALANAKSKEIGELQTKIEMIRFKHFNELLTICTASQKEKLKPVIVELFGRKPPKQESPDKKPSGVRKEEPRQDDKNINNESENKPPPDNSNEPPKDDRRDGRPGPPTEDEKLAKLSERLNLTDAQSKQIRAVFQVAKQKSQQLRSKANPTPDEVEVGREKIRKEEDEGIKKILTDEQKKEFEKMLSKRRK